MRYALTAVVFFLLGVGAQRHLSGDELKLIGAEVDLLEAHVENLLLRCRALEREAAELRVRPQALRSESF